MAVIPTLGAVWGARMLEGVVRGVSLCLVGLLALAIAHKVSAIRSGTAGTEPLMRLSEWRRRHAVALLALVAVLETLVALALLVAPLVGYGAILLLTVCYSLEIRRLAPEEPCNCFGGSLRLTRAGALQRNLLLAAIAGLALILYVAGLVGGDGISQTALGIALIFGAAFGAWDALQRIRPPRPTTSNVLRERA